MNNNKFLGKDIEDVKIEDLIEYFSVEQEETSTIEFKSGEVALEKIYTEVCAFLNTNGGILIIGAPKKSDNRNKEIYKGDLIPTKNIKSSFILSQKISSYIVPAGLNIKIKELDYKEGKIYILDVPQSKYPPHQNSLDGIYYIRLESETTKAPHGLIQAMFNKRQNPNLEIDLSDYTDSNNKKHILFHLYNQSSTTALKGGYIIEVFGIKSFEKINKKESIKRHNKVNIIHDGSEVTKNDDEYHFSFLGKFDTLNKGLFLPLEFLLEPLDSNYLIIVAIWAKDTELKYYLWVFNPIDNTLIVDSIENVVYVEDYIPKYNIRSSIIQKDIPDEK